MFWRIEQFASSGSEAASGNEVPGSNSTASEWIPKIAPGSRIQSPPHSHANFQIGSHQIMGTGAEVVFAKIIFPLMGEERKIFGMQKRETCGNTCISHRPPAV